MCLWKTPKMPYLLGLGPLFSLDIRLCSPLLVSLSSSCPPSPPPRTLPSSGVWTNPPRLRPSVWLIVAYSCCSLSFLSSRSFLPNDRTKARKIMCLWKTLFSHSITLGLSKWMPSENASSGMECSIMLATSSSLTRIRLSLIIKWTAPSGILGCVKYSAQEASWTASLLARCVAVQSIRLYL